ncbi:hypothetical protein RSAG8_07085, partial [Rhizoctonia solani AG-8 WAC10335]
MGHQTPTPSLRTLSLESTFLVLPPMTIIRTWMIYIDAGIDGGSSIFDKLYSISSGSSQESLFEPCALPPEPGSSNSTPQAPIIPEENPDTQGYNHERAESAAPSQPHPRPDVSSEVPLAPSHCMAPERGNTLDVEGLPSLPIFLDGKVWSDPSHIVLLFAAKHIRVV